MKKYYRGAHTKHRHMFHIIWLPKYRKKVLSGRVKARVEELIRECASTNNWEIQELNVQLDHVHLMIQLPPSVSVSKAVQHLKGLSSRMIRSELPEVKKQLWGTDFWAEGFFSETVGQKNEAAIRRYIQNQ